MADAFQVGAITAGRSSYVTFDYAEDLPVEPAILIKRDGKLMFPESQSWVERLSSGIWVLKPLNDLAISHESATAHTYTIRKADCRLNTDYVTEVPRQRVYSELIGIGAGADVDTSGDFYFEKRIRAGADWSGGALSDVEAGPSINNPNYPLDPLVVAPKQGLHASNQGYLIKLLIPGGFLSMGDFLFSCVFGGQLTAAGYGRFALVLTGNGKLTLYEKYTATGSTIPTWQTSPEWTWQAADPGQLAGGTLLIRILPHWPRFLEIKTFVGQITSVIGRQVGGGTFMQEAIRSGGDIKNGIKLIDLTNRGAYAVDAGRRLRPITGEGTVTMSVRRDLRMYWQVNRLAYPVSPGTVGVITDRPLVMPYGLGGAHVSRVSLQAYNTYSEAGGALTDITGALVNADGSTLTGANETYILNGVPINVSGWNPPGGLNKLKVVFTLKNLENAGSSWHTPMLEGYQVVRNGQLQHVAPGEKTGGKLKAVSITGPSLAPEHESARLTIQDPTNALAQIRARKAPVRIEVSWDPNNPGKRMIAFEGYTGRVTATQRGKSGKVYPSPDWHDLDLDLVGKWDRLSGKFFWQAFNFNDETVIGLPQPTGSGQPPPSIRQPWTVTGIIRYLLMLEGFADPGQLDIPEQALRIFVPVDGKADNVYQVMPGVTTLCDYLKTIAKNYLGAYLRWDANAGSAGMWRLKQPPSGTEPILWNFVSMTTPPAGKLAHLSASYGPRTSPILEIDGAPGYRQFTVPPECNCITVFGQKQDSPPQNLVRTYVNTESFSAPTHPNSANPASPDYLGRMLEVCYADPTLSTQQAVDFIARRLYWAAAKGHVIHQFTAEYALLNVADPSDPAYEPAIYKTRERRPLLPGDTVTVNGTRCIVLAANPAWTKDTTQCCWYEVEEWRYGVVY
jgi:hypothetical protein